MPAMHCMHARPLVLTPRESLPATWPKAPQACHNACTRHALNRGATQLPSRADVLSCMLGQGCINASRNDPFLSF